MIGIYQLPPELPQIPVTTVKKNRLNKYSVEIAQTAVNKILSGNPVQSAEESSLVRYFRLMSRDRNWITKNSSTVKNVVQAVNALYILSPNPKIGDKIAKYFLSNPELFKFTMQEVKLQVTDRKEKPLLVMPASSLVLGCQSSFFDRMFRGNQREGSELKKYHKDISQGQNPVIKIHEITPEVAVKFFQFLANSSSSSLPSQAEAKEWVEFVDRTESLETLFPKAQEIILSNLTEAILTQLYSNLMHQASASAAHVQEQMISWLRQPNAALFYKFACDKEMEELKQASVRTYLSNIDLEEASDGAMGKPVRGISGQAVIEHCQNWFFTQLPNCFEKLDHQIKIRSSLGSLCDSIKRSYACDKDYAQNVLYKFTQIAPSITKVSNPNLQRLTQIELGWVLSVLKPSKVLELNLSGCQIGNGKILEKFVNLRILKLKDCKSFTEAGSLYEMIHLEELDLSGCKDLFLIEVIPFNKLRYLHLYDTYLDPFYIKGNKGCLHLIYAKLDKRLLEKMKYLNKEQFEIDCS